MDAKGQARLILNYIVCHEDSHPKARRRLSRRTGFHLRASIVDCGMVFVLSYMGTAFLASLQGFRRRLGVRVSGVGQSRRARKFERSRGQRER